MSTRLSSLAKQRLRRFAIPTMMLDLLDRCGTVVRSNGVDRVFFDKSARARVKRIFGGDRGMRVIEPWMNVFMLVSDDGTVVTVGHQHKRVHRP